MGFSSRLKAVPSIGSFFKCFRIAISVALSTLRENTNDCNLRELVSPSHQTLECPNYGVYRTHEFAMSFVVRCTPRIAAAKKRQVY